MNVALDQLANGVRCSVGSVSPKAGVDVEATTNSVRRRQKRVMGKVDGENMGDGVEDAVCVGVAEGVGKCIE